MRNISAVALLCLSASAVAATTQTFQSSIDDGGFRAAHALLLQIIEENAKARKLRKALDAANLSSVTMSVGYFMGAELVFSEATPLSNFYWKEEALHGELSAKLNAGVDPSEYRLQCRSKLGARAELKSAMTPKPGGMVLVEASGIDVCWKLEASKIEFAPVGASDLEGAGKGTEFIPPELVELDYHQVEEIFYAHQNDFRYCLQKLPPSRRRKGDVSLGFHIATDGSVDEAKILTSTIEDDDLESCLVSRMLKIKFPPPMGGYEGGEFPLSFQE